MPQLSRRSFFQTGAASALLSAAAAPAGAQTLQETKPDSTIHFLHDGLPHTPAQYADLLKQVATKDAADSYMSGGAVAKLEEQFAQLLGKERAIFLPTGTLANHLALRINANGKSRVLAQAESHIYRDSLDCVTALSHLNLVPVGEGKATVLLDEIKKAYEQSQDKPYPISVGAISLECPVRRKDGGLFDFGELTQIAEFAKSRELKLHLDGARLWIAAAYSGRDPRDYAGLADTVYISLYKCFNAGAGAILAGDHKTIEEAARLRKIFGAGMLEVWHYASIAAHYLSGFADRFKNAVDASETLLTNLAKHDSFRVERIPNGTNIARLHLKDVDLKRFHESLAKEGIYLQGPSNKFTGFNLTINESINRRSPEEIHAAFVRGLKN